jgi:RimJ/RimL family protein N-acetyltransferase
MPGPRVASGDTVTLRTLERDDLQFLQRVSTNPDLRYTVGAPLRTLDDVESFYERSDEDRFLVCLDADDAGSGHPDADAVRRIGVLTVGDTDWRRPELGYWLVPQFHGEGYGREAVSLLVDYTFRTYGHPAVGARTFAANDASRGLLDALGFAKEGRIRRDMFVDGAYQDTVLYGLLREEWDVSD